MQERGAGEIIINAFVCDLIEGKPGQRLTGQLGGMELRVRYGVPTLCAPSGC